MNPTSIRTDLAVEQTKIYKNNLPQGVSVKTEDLGGIKTEIVDIKDKLGEQVIGKPIGRYVTFNIPSLGSSNVFSDEQIDPAAGLLRSMLPKGGTVFVAGLGNDKITPDALGPKTAEKILSTRHIPKQQAQNFGLSIDRSAAAIAPGVLGQTGIETSEIIAAVCKEIKPAAVIAVDALAAADTARLGTTVQIADSGISPGSGVLNKRKSLSKETLGVPVVSVGIPTVVDGGAFAAHYYEDGCAKKKDVGQDMMITPREIDLVIEHGSQFISLVINKAVQESMSIDDISFLTS